MENYTIGQQVKLASIKSTSEPMDIKTYPADLQALIREIIKNYKPKIGTILDLKPDGWRVRAGVYDLRQAKVECEGKVSWRYYCEISPL